MDSNAIYSVLTHASSTELRDFVHGLPPDPMRDIGESLLNAERPGNTIVALGSVTINYCNGSQPLVGRELALALHRMAVDLYENAPDHHGLLPTTLSGLAQGYVKASNLLGRSQEAVSFAESVIPYYSKLEPENLHSIKLGRIEALINLNRLSEADKLMMDPDLPGNPVSDIEFYRLRGILDKLLGRIDKDRGSDAPPSGVISDATQDLFVKAMSKLVDDAGIPIEAKTLLASLVNSPHLDSNVPEDHARLLEILRRTEDFMTRGAAGDSAISVRQRIREATGIFVASRNPPETALKQSLSTLEQCLVWADANQIVDLQNDANWGIYLCQSRLGDPSRAADALLRLRGNLEAMRAGITDVTRRAGAFSQYKYLFAASCEKLYLAGRIPEMLEAIEASKGRAVADLLTQRAGKPIADSDIYNAARALPELCRSHHFHYLTFFVDDDLTYAVFVSSSGLLQAPAPVPLGREAIRNIAVPATPDSATQLAPLLGWLAALLSDGTVRPNDHICISADEDLANVSFGCLPLGDAPLAELLTTSRIHNAWHLSHLLEERAQRPAAYLGVVVPSRQNVTSANWAQMRASMRKPIARLVHLMPGERLEGATASRATLAKQDLRGRAVHFSTHGMFPSNATQGAPYDDSGLLLTDGKELPDTGAIDRDNVLTPRAVLDDQLDLTGSHATLMACVSGLSREGIGGDALGMEWALLQAGAASVLSTHWDVSAQLAANFVDLFYEEWLQHDESRAQAWRKTIVALREAGGSPAAMESWGAFTLSGDWR